MSLKNFLGMQSLANAMSQLSQVEQKLAAHLAEEKDKITAEFEEAIAHFKEEIAHLRGKVDPAIVAHIDEGVDPHTAFQLASQGVPTQADAQANQDAADAKAAESVIVTG